MVDNERSNSCWFSKPFLCIREVVRVGSRNVIQRMFLLLNFLNIIRIRLTERVSLLPSFSCCANTENRDEKHNLEDFQETDEFSLEEFNQWGKFQTTFLLIVRKQQFEVHSTLNFSRNLFLKHCLLLWNRISAISWWIMWNNTSLCIIFTPTCTGTEGHPHYCTFRDSE